MNVKFILFYFIFFFFFFYLYKNKTLIIYLVVFKRYINFILGIQDIDHSYKRDMNFILFYFFFFKYNWFY